MKKPSYLVYDIETIPDITLFRNTKYPENTEEQALELYAQKRGVPVEEVFLPPQYHTPVSIAVLKLDSNYLPMERVKTISDPKDPSVGVCKFWQAVDLWQPILVDFNGRGFDLPVLTTCAFSEAIPVPSYFAPSSQRADYRYRYGQKHIDLQDWISGYGPLPGGLSLFSVFAGGLGKTGIDGSMVHDYWRACRYDEIDDYCRADVEETYRVFLRTRLLMGKITWEMEKELLAALEVLE